MVKFLIRRPIAVSMTFIAILVLGGFAMKFIPVSLMPDVDIPEITVQLSVPNRSARELENTVVQPIRRQLMQVGHLADISSETRNENSLIHLEFEYGTDIDFAFVEVNEKIDRAMNSLPRSIDRPKVIKANATDIPVFYLNLTLHEESDPNNQTIEQLNTQTSNLYPVSQKFVEMSRFATNVIRRRIEQLPEVAMVDMSGLVSSELLILPDNQKLSALGISLDDLEHTIENNNIQLGSLLIRDGQYQYNIRFSSTLQNKQDIENIYFKINDRLLQLKDVATVVEHPQPLTGKVTSNGADAVTIAVIKQSDAQMSDLRDNLNQLITYFEEDYPDINFEVTRNQTRLLDYSISNLQQNLIWGALLAFVVLFLFLKEYQAPILIGITVPTSLVISMLMFFALGISVNIISLSGIILGVGMMVDNSIIVIDNITQYRQRLGHFSKNAGSLKILEKACANGTNEVFRPMLSSVLTTCAVFIPLIFISGISGALFYDQAMAVATGLMVSLAVSVTLLPVYYRLLYKKTDGKKIKFLNKNRLVKYEDLYMKGLRFIFRKQKITFAIVGFCLFGMILLFVDLDKSRLPEIEETEVILAVDWNEQIHIDENKNRIELLIAELGAVLEQNTCMIGEQQFLLDKTITSSSSEAIVYIKVIDSSELIGTIAKASEFIQTNYPHAILEQREADNIFSTIFASTEEPLTARIRTISEDNSDRTLQLRDMLSKIQSAVPDHLVEDIPVEEYVVLKTDPTKLMLYDVNFNMMYLELQSAFNDNEVFLITDNQDFVPVILGGETQTIQKILNELFVHNTNGKQIPIRDLISETKGEDLKYIVAGQEGEYYPVNYQVEDNEVNEIQNRLKSVVGESKLFDLSFSGSILSNRELMQELFLILLVSLALLYFIMSSQFESLVLPLIILIEVVIDIFGAFLALKLGDSGINIMSLIGIVVMSGIVINDSILKVDTMNQLYRQGYSLMHAIVEAGHRRLTAILMTSMTTILALVPLLFSSGLGADLQRPLALAVIGGMILGTLISLYLVPLLFYYFKRTKILELRSK